MFDAARRYGIGFHPGSAEIAHETDETGKIRKRRFNTSILVSPEGDILLKYRKVHFPGHAEYGPGRTTIFAFDKHRRPEAYGRIIGQTGAVAPEVCTKR